MIKKFVSCIAVIALSAIFAFGTTVIVPTDNDLIVGSRLIIRGKVIAKETRQDNPTMAVFTYTTLEVIEVYKGQLSTSQITIKEVGGVYKNVGSILYGVPEYSINEDVILYLDTWADGSLRTYQWFLGKYTVSAENGNLFVSRDLGLSNVNILNLNSVNTQKEDFAIFTSNLAEKIKNLKLKSDAHFAKYYNGSKIQTKPLELSVNSIPNFTLLNNPPLRWFGADLNQSVPYKINTSGIPAGYNVSLIGNSLSAWSTVSGSSLRLSNAGSTSGCALLSLDGENTISFNNCDSYPPFSPPSGGCSGILAAAGIIQYDPFQTKVVNGITFYKAIEANLSFNPYASCHFSNPCNVQEVMSHELGHTVGLGHSLDDDATMRAYAHFDGRCASIKIDDQNGARFIYPANNGNPNPTPNPTPLPQITKKGDYNGDGRADFAIWRGNTSEWKILQSSNGQLNTVLWGASYSPYLDIPVPGDYDGDRKYDFSVYRALTRYWLVKNSSGGNLFQMFGTPSEVKVPADYDADGKTDIAIFIGGYWAILKSSDGTLLNYNLGNFGDVPFAEDIDGDKKADPIVFNNGNWTWQESYTGQVRNLLFGSFGGTPVMSDFDGDKKADFAVFKDSYWYIRNSSNSLTTTVYWGSQNSPYYDILVPADYDGDGKDDVAVWRSSTGWWYGISSANGQIFAAQNGQFGDVPVVK